MSKKRKTRRNLRKYRWWKSITDMANQYCFETTQGEKFAVIRTNYGCGWKVVEVKE